METFGKLDKHGCIVRNAVLALCRRKVPLGTPRPSVNDEMDVSQPEQVILDPNAMSKASGNQYFELGSWMVRLLVECSCRQHLVPDALHIAT